MPALDEHDRQRLLVATSLVCPDCRALLYRNYCRQCDEFFYVCKSCRFEQPGHNRHRTY